MPHSTPSPGSSQGSKETASQENPSGQLVRAGTRQVQGACRHSFGIPLGRRGGLRQLGSVRLRPLQGGIPSPAPRPRSPCQPPAAPAAPRPAEARRAARPAVLVPTLREGDAVDVLLRPRAHHAALAEQPLVRLRYCSHNPYLYVIVLFVYLQR